MAIVTSPTYSNLVRQAFLLEPLGGPKDVFYYLDRFPEEIWNKSPDSHLYKFMRTLLGENGVNWIKKDYLQARLMLEEYGIDSFDLDRFFGSPLAFGRIAAESFDDDVSGLITKDQWEQIKAKNARYRNRALDFINGARAGNTPLGMKLVAKAGLGHDVEIIENYRYLFDVHSDDPLGLAYFGKTLSTEEMIVLPKREVGVSESQEISLVGKPNQPNAGHFYFVYNGDASVSYSYVYDNRSLAEAEAGLVVGTVDTPTDSAFTLTDGTLEVLQFLATQDGTVNQLHAWMLDFGSGYTSMDIVLYADNAGVPGALLDKGTAPPPTIGGGNQWVSASGTMGATITAGRHYWIGLNPHGGSAYPLYGTGEPPPRHPVVDAPSTYAIPPNPFPASPSGGTTRLGLYVSGNIAQNTIPWNATNDQVRLALESIPQIGAGNVNVSGGPGPNNPWFITFKNALSNKDVPELKVIKTDLGFYTDSSDSSTLVSSNEVEARIITLIGGIESIDEIAFIPDKDQYMLQSALDRIRPQTTIPTVGSSPGNKSRANWLKATASSEYIEVVRYVTGSSSVPWPTSQPFYWIRSNVEQEAPRIPDDLQHHYTGFHNVSSVTASSGTKADMVLADYAEPLFVTSARETGNRSLSLINGVYPVDYQQLSGIPPVRYNTEQAWVSTPQVTDEWLILQLPFVQAMNYLSFDIERTNVQINLEYDSRDQGDPHWVDVTPIEPYSNVMLPPLDSTHTTWASVGLTFTNYKNQMTWTRAIRINLVRLNGYTGSISLRNLRVARNVG